MSITVAGAGFAHPGGVELFSNVTFKIGSREHAALVGENGAGKSTLMRIMAGELEASEGEVRVDGSALYLSQDIGFAASRTVRELLLDLAPPHLRVAGLRLLAAERQLAAGKGDGDGGMELGLAIGPWSELGGYELEGRWDASVRRILGIELGEAESRRLTQLSGGELKRLAIDVLFASHADVLLLDEPDNYLDVPAKLWLEELIRTTKKTVLTISHDREFLCNTSQKVVTLEGYKTWLHGGSYASYAQAREARQASLQDELERWHEEERRLFQYMKIMKQRAAVNSGNAPRAKAAETRWTRFADAGPPAPPAPTRPMKVRLRGADSARQVLVAKGVGLHGLIQPFSDVIVYGERLALIGPNGTGKTHLLQILAGARSPSHGSVAIGSRASVGVFTQVNDRPDFLGVPVGDIVEQRVGNHEKSRQLLACYGLERSVRQKYDTLSGGQKARLEILVLEIEGHNFLLLDEPTDNLDVGSAEALEEALDRFDGTCLSVSHDRSFLRRQDRYWLLDGDGALFSLSRYEDALASVMSGRVTGNFRALRS